MPGTPKNLKELVLQELTDGPINTLQLRLELALRDFIRNRLATAFIRAGDDQNRLEWLHEVGALLGTNEKVNRTELTPAELEYIDGLFSRREKVS